MAENPVFDLYRPALHRPSVRSGSTSCGDPANWRRHRRKPAPPDGRGSRTSGSARSPRARSRGCSRRSSGKTIVAPASAATDAHLHAPASWLESRRLPHFVDVPVAHKTGDAGNIADDVGIIYARSGPIVIAVLAAGITGSYGDAEDRIGRIAESSRSTSTAPPDSCRLRWPQSAARSATPELSGARLGLEAHRALTVRSSRSRPFGRPSGQSTSAILALSNAGT